MSLPNKKIAVIGGYGRAGREIIRLLTKIGDYEITIAGRMLAKAQKFAEKFQAQHPQKSAKTAAVDITKKKQLAGIIENTHLVIVCVPLDCSTANNLIDTVLKTDQTHYIDLSPSSGKLRAFIKNEARINRSKNVFILDAGFEPGLPRFLAELLLSRVKGAEKLVIEGRYRDSHISAGAIKDILRQDENTSIFESGKWRKTSLLHAKRISFPCNFGIALSIPLRAAELEHLPEKYGLDHLAYYHAGVNALANFVMFSWQVVLNLIFPISMGVILYRWAIRSFTKRPYGGVIKARTKGPDGDKEAIVWHKNLYEATAIQVVATARMLLEKSSPEHGYYYMGEWVEIDTFLRYLKDFGMEINVGELDN